MKKIFVCLSAITLFIIGCSKTNEEAESRASTGNTGGTTNNCDTVNMKYAANIQPILQANCVSCHNVNKANGGVMLDSYASVKTVAADSPPNNATSSTLVSVITHRSGYPAMPYNRPKLSDCDINKIKAWISRNAPNN